VGWARQAYLRDGPGTFAKINRRRKRINQHWIRLIDIARGAYQGRLTYAANFDRYQAVGFWNHLDLMGINAYFSLRGEIDHSLTTEDKSRMFERRWREILDDIHGFQEQQGLGVTPFIFTELGYTNRRDSTIEPWSHSGFSVIGWKTARRRLIVWDEQPVDYSERAAALTALRVAHLEQGSGLRGILYWKLSTIKEHEMIEPFALCIDSACDDPLTLALRGFVDPVDSGEPDVGAVRSDVGPARTTSRATALPTLHP
jgi:hypothetical protein